MLRIVPLGDFHIFLSLNSFTRASSGVMVAHLTPTLCFWMALAESVVTLSSVASRFCTERS
jgi:threonine/homoserine efflux transporter RhtA